MLKLVMKVRQKKANDLLEVGIEGEKEQREKWGETEYWDTFTNLKIKLTNVPEGSNVT